MKEHATRLSRALIVGHGRDGRCLYDSEAKHSMCKKVYKFGNYVQRSVVISICINGKKTAKIAP